MIVELIRVAEAAGLTGHESRHQRPIHWFIDLDKEGRLLGFSPTSKIVQNRRGERIERRGKAFKVSANYHMQWKDGKIQSVCTNQHNWLPDFLTGPANEIFPDGVSDQNPVAHKQKLWQELVMQAKSDLPTNEVIGAVAEFLEGRPKFRDILISFTDGEKLTRLLEDLDAGKETLSFRINGRVAFRDQELQNWWAFQVENQRSELIKRLGKGKDAFLEGNGPITEYFPTVLGGIPFASFNAAPFISYGLGSQTATFRLETAEKTAAGLNALLNNPNTSLQLGDETVVFWAVHWGTGEHHSADFLQLLGQRDPLAVRDYMQGVWGSRAPQVSQTDFQVAILLKGTGRFSVRSWHTETLAKADRNVRYYFEAIRLSSREDDTPTLHDLAWATIAKVRGQKTKPPATTFNAIFEAAWRGTAIPYSLLAAVIERQNLEMAGGHPDSKEFMQHLSARTAVIQLYFALKDKTLTTLEKTMDSKDTAILCGRLLAILDKIHDVAHDGRSASSPANRLYGAAAATPALVFPRLFQLARHHLQKMDGGMARKLELGVHKDRRDDNVPEDFEGLAAIVSRLKEVSGSDFPRLLSLEDQGRFALGFYYERARRWPNYKSDKSETSNS